MIMKNIKKILDKGICSGCGACGYACSVNAIHFEQDENGFLCPTINYSKCVDCGKCINICPMKQETSYFTKTDVLQYAVKCKDNDIRERSRSGGVFSMLSDIILEEGGCIFGAVFDEQFNVYHSLATDKIQRNLMCGSKYVQSDSTKIYELLEEKISKNKPVLFTGTPCQVAAVANLFDQSKYNNLVLCDFICHGVPSPKLWTSYLNWCEKKYKGKVINASFRDKNKFGWSSHIENVNINGKDIWSMRYKNLFYSNECLRNSCYSCPYTRIERVSDFTIGDYWGIEDIDPEFNDEKGISIVFIRTEKAKNLFDKFKEKSYYINTSNCKPPHYNLYNPTERPITRDSFWKDFNSKGFEYVSKKYGGYDLLRRIKIRMVKKIM